MNSSKPRQNFSLTGAFYRSVSTGPERFNAELRPEEAGSMGQATS